MTDRYIARTGRVQSWLDNPESKLPVSCTVFVVDDSMEGPNGIESSWRFVSHALRNAAGVAGHLSKLRPRGEENGKGLVASGPVSFARVYSVLNETLQNLFQLRPRGAEKGKGLVASGPVSFAKIYSVLNETLRRGGTYKNGACVIHLDANHADLEEFVDASRAELPWVKKCIDITPEWWNELSESLQEKIFKAIQAGDIWLNKVKYDKRGNRIYGNVCLEIYLPSRGTCLLQHVQLGSCNVEDLYPAFTEGMRQLVDLHGRTGVGDTGEYLSPDVDRQVGLGVLGLANFLSLQGVSYAAFGEALEAVNEGLDVETTPAIVLAREWVGAIAGAAQIARAAGMDRAFTIAPTASCSYKYKDLEGFTTAPEIAPPISRVVDRDSGTFGVESFDYGNVEIASDVGWYSYKKVVDEICRTFANTGLFHGYSFNSWSDVVSYDQAFIQDWLQSPQTSLYYALQVMPDTLRKDDATAIIEGDDYADIFGFASEMLDDLDADDNDPFCSSCAE
jgi:hypothetical protein